MRAVRVHAPGGPEALRVETVAPPELRTGEVLVRLEAAGVNFVDVYKRTGLYALQFPATLGEEGAGTVEATGTGVDDVRPGDRVAWAHAPGSYAEYVRVPVAKLVRLPDAVSTAQGAALMLQGMTAHYLATTTWPLKANDRCLVHAAAGGVGLLLVQIAKQRGAFVIGTVGSDEKAGLARGAGADEVIVYTREDFVARTRQVTDGRGVHVIYDAVGRTTFLAGLDVLVPRGMMVLYGQSSGVVAPLDPRVLNEKGSLFLTRPSLRDYTATPEELRARADDLFGWLSRGSLRLRIGAEYALADVAEAHRALEGRRTTGKVLLRP
jgi:NADPH2:quinone reductase